MDGLEMIRSLYGYNRWVNQRLLDVVEQVPPERTREVFGGSFDTIHGTTAHILQGEMHYYSRATGLGQTQRPAELEKIEEIRALWEEHHAKMEQLLRQLTPERSAEIVRYSTRTGETYELPLWQVLLQMVNHGTHHRAELADMLTRVGCPPPPTDYIVYCQEQGQVK